MHEYPDEVAKSARWIYERKHRSLNWNWWALSVQNPDTEGLKYPEVIAFHIISILASKGLLKPIGDSAVEFALDLSDTDKWEEAMAQPSWFEKKILQPLDFAGRHVWIFILWMITLVLSGALTHLAEVMIDRWTTP